MVIEFILSSKKQQNELEETMKRLSATTKTIFKNQQASVWNIKNQVG